MRLLSMPVPTTHSFYDFYPAVVFLLLQHRIPIAATASNSQHKNYRLFLNHLQSRTMMLYIIC